MSDPQPVRTIVSPPLPRAAPIEHLHERLSVASGVESVTLTLDGGVTNLARGMARALEDTLRRMWPSLHPRCVGYTRETTLPITVGFEHDGVLHVVPVAVTIEQTSTMTMLAVHDELLAQAGREIAFRTNLPPIREES